MDQLLLTINRNQNRNLEFLLFTIAADIDTILCNGNKLRFLFDNAKQCEKVKRVVKIDGPVKDEERREAESLGINLINILEVEVRSAYETFCTFSLLSQRV